MKNDAAPTKKRGRGRPRIEDTGAYVIALRLTERQKETFDLMGRVHWLRSELDQLRTELERKERRERARPAPHTSEPKQS